MTVSDGAADQADQALRNIDDAPREVGSADADIVRMRYIRPQASDVAACRAALKSDLGTVRPAATMIEAGLADPRMKIEIDVTARHSA